jgi:hypothetical protein
LALCGVPPLQASCLAAAAPSLLVSSLLAPSNPPSVLAAAVVPGALARDEAPGFDEGSAAGFDEGSAAGFDEGSAPGFDKGPQLGQQPAMTPRERLLDLERKKRWSARSSSAPCWPSTRSRCMRLR